VHTLGIKMFIYKITVLPLNQVYIGLDTKPVYKQSRWKTHCRVACKQQKNSKLYKAMRQFGIDQCLYEVIADNFGSIGELALAEISLIQQLDSYKNGLNSTPGGDGLGKKNLSCMAESEIQQIRNTLGESFKEYNRKKWQDTTPEQRKEMVKHAFTPEVNEKRRGTLKQYYKSTPGARESKAKSISEWQQNNQEEFIKNNRNNGIKGAQKVSKKLLVEMPDGSMLNYSSKSEFQRSTNQWAKTVLEKTKQGFSHNGYKAWEQ
jgi:hypothetical protein